MFSQNSAGDLAKVKAGRLQRLDKSTGQTNGYAICRPLPFPSPDPEFHNTRWQRFGMFTLECSHFIFCIIVADVGAGMYVAE